MTRDALLLRGVNVGGHRKLSMPDLTAVLSALGHIDVSTSLQSGNAVLTAKGTTAAKLAAGVEESPAAELAVTTRVLVRTHPDLAGVGANPFPEAAAEKPAWLHVASPAGPAAPSVAVARPPDHERSICN